MRTVTLAEAAHRLRFAPPPIRADRSDVMIMIDLDAPATAEARRTVTALAPDAPIIVAAFTRRGELATEDADLLDVCDVVYAPRPDDRRCVASDDPHAHATALWRAVQRNPEAALCLAQVLRASERVSRPQAIDIESFAYSTLLGGPEFARWLEERGPARDVPDSAHPVLSERDGSTLTITLNRPERRNAYGRQVRDALAEALAVAMVDRDVAEIAVRGAGTVFCAGGDLAEFGLTPDLVTAHFVRTQGGVARLMHALAARTVVHVHGACIGAGIEVPAFAARLSSAPGTVFKLPEVSMGLIPGAGGTASIPARIGRWRTLHWAVTGDVIDVERALDWGLIDNIHNDDEEYQKIGLDETWGGRL